MILTDAGPLVAIIDRGEADHDSCVSALASLTRPMLTTWPAFTEAIYLLGDGGWVAQDALWRLLLRGDIEMADITGPVLDRTFALMEKYQDTPMDLADASLVAVAEARGLTRIFTLDSHFRIYRRSGKNAFEIVPSPS